jgi:hypothetical protein
MSGDLDISAWALCPRARRVIGREGATALDVDWLDPRTREAMLREPWRAEALSRGCAGVRVLGAACGTDERSLQGYTLRIGAASGGASTHAIEVEASTRAGARHGVATMLQLLRVSPRDERGRAVLPHCEVRDWPVLATRGVMLDISRTRVPRMDELLALPALLAGLKVNHVQLYVEHTLAYAGHEDAWRGCSAVTLEELVRLRQECEAFGISLGANQNCFGHLSHWLRQARYSHLAETHGEWMFDVWARRGAFSLCPGDPGSIALVRDMLAQQCGALRGEAASGGSLVCNIGCDEVYDIAFGRSAEQVRARGRLAVYAEFVDRVASAARASGARPALWADVVLHGVGDAGEAGEGGGRRDAEARREALAMLRSHDAIALVWGYEPDAPFDAHVGRTREAGLEAWVCPGTSCWRSITGRTRERRGNLHAAARVGADGANGGVTGMLACVWGDLGHWQQWPVTLHALGQAAGAMWSGGVDPDGTAHGPHVFGGLGVECSRGLAGVLEALGDADAALRDVAGPLAHPTATRLRNATALFASLHAGKDRLRAFGQEQLWREALERMEAQREPLGAAVASSCLLGEEAEWTIDMAAFAAKRAIAIVRDASDGGSEGEGLERAAAELRERFARLWLCRSRVGGLEESLAHFGALVGSAKGGVA